MVVIVCEGKIGITNITQWAEPKDLDNPDDIEAAERIMQFKMGWFTNPIFGNGDYPAILKAQLAKKAKEFGLPSSPLPVFTEDQKRLNRGLKCVFYMLIPVSLIKIV
jgi:lactase-phlorizin hydrolase